MSAPQWVPGPYSVESNLRCDGDTDYETLRIVSANARFGGTVATMHRDAQTGMRTDTARLLAAAPDLYAALRAILAAEPSSARTANGNDLERHEARQASLIRPARAALAKAEGRQA